MSSSEFRDFFRDSSVRPLAMEIHNDLAKRQDKTKELLRSEKLCDDRKKSYLTGARNVLNEAKSLAAKLRGHPKALAEVENFLDLTTTEGSDYDLSYVGMGWSSSGVANALRWWDKGVVPKIKSHGIVPALAVGRCGMHALLGKLVQLQKLCQDAACGVVGGNAQVNVHQANLQIHVRKLKDKLKAWKVKTQQPAALKLIKVIEDIECRVRKLET